jgi:hypothetical protein
MWDSHVLKYVIQFLDHNFYYKQNITSVLDLGAGEGWLSIWLRYLFMEQPSDRKTWNHKINAIEIYSPYLYSLNRQYYSNVFNEDIFQSDKLSGYDLVIGLEVLEHIPKEKALELVQYLQENNKYVFFSTPDGFREAPLHHGNPYQKHLSGFSKQDFTKLGFKTVIKDNLYLFIFSKELEWSLPFFIRLRRIIIPEIIRKRIIQIQKASNKEKWGSKV